MEDLPADGKLHDRGETSPHRRRGWKDQTVLFTNSFSAGEISDYVIALRLIGERRAAFGQLLEPVLESAWRDDLQNSAWSVARVPERMPLIAGFDDELARPGKYCLITKRGPELAFEDETVFILICMSV